MKINDSQLYALFAGMLDGSGECQISPRNSQSEPYAIEVESEVHDNHRGDSPDLVLHLTVTINHPKLPPLVLQVPVPIEGEKAGINAAVEDLKKFAEREHFAQRLPMLVIGGSGNPARRVVNVKMPARCEIVQIPYRLLANE